MPVEMRVVALLARGDKYKDIVVDIQTEFGRSISEPVISAVKKRNASSLALIRQRVVALEQADSEALLRKTHRLINKRLSQAENDLTARELLDQQLMNGEIDYKTWDEKRRALGAPPTLAELTTVSKEMFHQSRIEGGKPTAIVSTPEEARQKLIEAQQLIEEDDEINLLEKVFTDDSPPTP